MDGGPRTAGRPGHGGDDGRGTPRIVPKVGFTGDAVQVEFRIEDLVRRVMPGAALSHCNGCYGCSGCNH